MLNGHNARSLGVIALWYFLCAACGVFILLAALTFDYFVVSRNIGIEATKLFVYMATLAPVVGWALSLLWVSRVGPKLASTKRGEIAGHPDDNYAKALGASMLA